ncbi:MAG: DUF3267 domain-containing protein [Clostridia bacterium]|nr:DUF3267 domain-containing protein [Clostridia bacterium]
MKSFQTLPQDYEEIYSIDLQKDKKMSLIVNAISIVIALVLGYIGHLIVPITALFDLSNGLTAYTQRFAVLIAGMIAYIILHELVHGITMKMCGTKKIKYGFTGMYAFAGSDDYYDKKSYITIALAPIMVWGIVLACINPFVSQEWFWIVYFIQLLNLSGAAGDLFVTIKFSRLPKDILIKDYGVGMTVYSAKKE